MRNVGRRLAIAGRVVLLASGAWAQGAKRRKKCAPDAVVAGTICLDKYEASVWRVPGAWTENTSLVRKIQQGKVKLAELDAIDDQLGTGPGDYGDCTAEGAGCDEIFAVSIAGALPSSDTTWFQAQQACKNSRKRLPTNAEWQAAVV